MLIIVSYYENLNTAALKLGIETLSTGRSSITDTHKAWLRRKMDKLTERVKGGVSFPPNANFIRLAMLSRDEYEHRIGIKKLTWDKGSAVGFGVPALIAVAVAVGERVGVPAENAGSLATAVPLYIAGAWAAAHTAFSLHVALERNELEKRTLDRVASAFTPTMISSEQEEARQ